MRFIARNCIISHASKLFSNPVIRSRDQNFNLFRQYMTVISNKRLLAKYPSTLVSFVCLDYSSDSKKHFINLEKKTDALKDVIEHRKEQLKGTEQRIRQRGEEIVRDIKHQKEVTGQKLRVKKDHLIKDILETKAKVKERIEEVVEVITQSLFTHFVIHKVYVDTFYLLFSEGKCIYCAKCFVFHKNSNVSILGICYSARRLFIGNGFISICWGDRFSK